MKGGTGMRLHGQGRRQDHVSPERCGSRIPCDHDVQLLPPGGGGTRVWMSNPPPANCWPEAPLGGGGGVEGALGGSVGEGGPGGAIWGGGYVSPRPSVGQSQAPLTSPCPTSNHTITINLSLIFAASYIGHGSHVDWAKQDPPISFMATFATSLLPILERNTNCDPSTEQLVQPNSAQAVRGSDMEDVVRFVNVDLIEFHALRHKHELQAHGVHGLEHGVVGEKQGVVHPPWDQVGVQQLHPLKSVQWRVLVSRQISCGRPHEVVTCLLFPGQMCQEVSKVVEDRGLQRQSRIAPRDGIPGRGLSSRHTLTAGGWGPTVHLCL